MSGPVATYLASDHARLGDLLNRCLAESGVVDRAPYDEFRVGLLRHIAMEEKILLPLARKLRGGDPLPATDQLKRDHAALAALLVPTPTSSIIDAIQSILLEHNRLEEGLNGIYQTCEQLAGEEASALAAQLRSAPDGRVAPHHDTPLVQEHIQKLLALRHAP